MKKMILALALFLPVAAVAQQYGEIVLFPGESRYIRQGTRVTCAPDDQYGSTGVCQLLGAGTYKGVSWNYRIAVDGSVIDAVDFRSSALTKLKNLQQNGVCTVRPYAPCRLMGAGPYKGVSWNYRIAIGTEVVEAVDFESSAYTVLNELRGAGVCR